MPQIEHFQAIEWEESMATGIDSIDKQHHYLVETLQEMNTKLLDDDSEILLSHVVKDLLGYALMHFETEEALMQRYDYATACPEEAQAHIAQHRDFSHQVVTVRDQLREGQKVSRVEILRFLNHWLRDHVLGIDQSLGRFLREKMR
ncbi:MAG: hypothetical protein B6D77_18410 [gamma proteobacterium symbiont of Ctena orbiculata]|nr:MAG: hypothetical protein B6D77_18410 [gamma proteobacterium symbiont of Ctena orbiculata]PVV19317.1 MAG: hypothetical protein B6D78_13770 [gamma proteobacterium symbiont of Ctena orbiculata]PVV27586.1 MAG: hypothetical protein B6D79_01655 [gamma proteobacterium symbiont of Ctena orbiculata]